MSIGLEDLVSAAREELVRQYTFPPNNQAPDSVRRNTARALEDFAQHEYIIRAAYARLQGG